jgi:predicted transcriptional regulator
MESKGKAVKWLNIFLLVINISAFATFLFMNSRQETGFDDQYSSDEFLRDRLQLSDDQYEQILEMDQTVFRNYQLLLDIECESNFELIKALSSENTSNEEISEIVEKIGRYHGLVKKQTVKHFQNIKSICTEEQKELLDALLLEMMEVGDQCQYCNKKNCSRRNQIEQKKN